MRAIIQRVHSASVILQDTLYGQIDQGILAYICMEQRDDEMAYHWMLKKIIHLRIFKDTQNDMNISLIDIQGSLLCIPNFTLLATVKKGNRPNFSPDISFEEAKRKFEQFIQKGNELLSVQAGVFGAYMRVCAEVDGPINIIIDTPESKSST